MKLSYMWVKTNCKDDYEEGFVQKYMYNLIVI